MRTYPLNALRAFEASARHLSYVRAAEELFVTPAALSHQVKRLESYLGVPLFRRQARGLLLTDAGQRLLPELSDVFVQLDQAMLRAREDERRGALTVSVAPMFLVKWLLPRLEQFRNAHPDIDLRLSSSMEIADFSRDAIDAAIRLGSGEYPGMHVDTLFAESVTPMCSPHLLHQGDAPPTASKLDSFVLLHDDSMAFDPQAPTWQTWFSAAGAGGVDTSHGLRFSQPDHAIQAAIDGAGIVLGWRHLAHDDIAAGRLVTPFELNLPLRSSFHLVYPSAFASRPKIADFRDWLLGEIN